MGGILWLRQSCCNEERPPAACELLCHPGQLTDATASPAHPPGPRSGDTEPGEPLKPGQSRGFAIPAASRDYSVEQAGCLLGTDS